MRQESLASLLVALLVTGCGGDDVGGPDAPSAPVPGTKASFDLDADPASPSAFFDLPWPSDLRLDDRGAPLFRALPNPRDLPLLTGLLGIAGDRRGFPVIPVAWFRFDAPLGERDRSVLAGATDDPVLLVDVDPESPERGRLFPLMAPTLPADALYVPENVLAVAPFPGVTLRPGRRYAFVVRREVGDASSAPLGVPAALVDLSKGRAPAGRFGAEAAALYAPLWETLDQISVPRTSVAAATVFTTGDVVADLAGLAERVVAAHDVAIEALQVDPDDGAAHPRFCELRGLVRYPQFQRGAPPFPTEGLFRLDSAGLPELQREEVAPVSITLPLGEMPAGGWPLVLYLHGSGGLSSQNVDMGRGTLPDGSAPLPGTGPAHYLAEHGFATAATALPVNPERLPGAGELAYLNFDNLAAFRDTFRQGVLEQHLFVEALGRTTIPPSIVTRCAGLRLPTGESAHRFRTETFFVQGQSMGGMYTNLIGPTHPRATAVVPTGAGGYWSKFIPETRLVGDLGRLAAILLGLTVQDRLDWFHPALHALQTGWEPVEPLVFVPRLYVDPLPGHPARQVYEPSSRDDSYFPTSIYDAFAVAYGNRQAGEEFWPGMQEALARVGRAGLLEYPVSHDVQSGAGEPVTGVVVQFLADGPYDPHSIYRQLDAVKYQYGCFLRTFRDTGIAVVPAPAPLGTPCPGL